MILPDVNILVYAHRVDAADHLLYRQWLEGVIHSGQPYGISDHVLSGFLRIATHRRIFPTPSPILSVLEFVRDLREQPNCRIISPGSRHWQIFTDLCKSQAATGNLIPDIWFAALAIESSCEWITTDSDYEKIPGLRWRHPITGKASK